jgi:hypothetical protein
MSNLQPVLLVFKFGVDFAFNTVKVKRFGSIQYKPNLFQGLPYSNLPKSK